MKTRVEPVSVERKYDYFTIVEKNGNKHVVYSDDYDKIVKYLMEIDETKFKDCYITPDVIAKKLCKKHPELKTNMFRPTGKYYTLYHLVLKILDYYRYIDYYKDGTILKNKKFIDITPIERGIERWI